MKQEIKSWRCNICKTEFHTTGHIPDEAVEHTLNRHMDYDIIGDDE